MNGLLLDNLEEAISRGDIETVYSIWKITRASKDHAQAVDEILENNLEVLIKIAHADYYPGIRTLDMQKLIQRYDIYRVQNLFLFGLETGDFVLLENFLATNGFYGSETLNRARKRLYYIHYYQKQEFRLLIGKQKPKNLERNLARLCFLFLSPYPRRHKYYTRLQEVLEFLQFIEYAENVTLNQKELSEFLVQEIITKLDPQSGKGLFSSRANPNSRFDTRGSLNRHAYLYPYRAR